MNIFDKLADQWWDNNGPFKVLHDINEIRLEYILRQFNSSVKRILDVGCGGGLISIPLAKLGYNVLGIDAGKANIKIAQQAAKNMEVKVSFSTKQLKNLQEYYDVVICMEVLEHVEEQELFLQQLSNRLKPGGLLIISTINQTYKSYIECIILAEYLLKWIPIGTHQWHAFVTPAQIVATLTECNLIDCIGIKYKLNRWKLENDTRSNYICTFIKV
jgi:2-polyprenyl-6-hydroxyphenyl methylase/3-demethylubiquinone-9 3-methyltransferase